MSFRRASAALARPAPAAAIRRSLTGNAKPLRDAHPAGKKSHAPPPEQFYTPKTDGAAATVHNHHLSERTYGLSCADRTGACFAWLALAQETAAALETVAKYGQRLYKSTDVLSRC